MSYNEDLQPNETRHARKGRAVVPAIRSSRPFSAPSSGPHLRGGRSRSHSYLRGRIASSSRGNATHGRGSDDTQTSRPPPVHDDMIPRPASSISSVYGYDARTGGVPRAKKHKSEHISTPVQLESMSLQLSDIVCSDINVPAPVKLEEDTQVSRSQICHQGLLKYAFEIGPWRYISSR